MIFDSVYDIYRGVITYVRVVDGRISARDRIKMMSTGATHELLEIGVISPEPKPVDSLGVGEVGYFITGVKDVRQSRVGDTVTLQSKPADRADRRVQRPQADGLLRASTRSTAASTRCCARRWTSCCSTTPPWSTSRRPAPPSASASASASSACCTWRSSASGWSARADCRLISTAPNVVYRVVMEDRTEITVTNPSDWPEGKIAEVYEPIVNATIIAPSDYTGTIMELCQSRRGSLSGMDYLSESRVELRYTLPLGEIIFDFFDALKSRTRGYACLDYAEAGEQQSQLVKVDILLQGEPVDAFSAIVHKDKAYSYGVMMAGKLRELIPRQQFEVPIQAAVGSRVIARETIRAIRKDVLAKCYGGDITRKRKLLEKQKEGKKRMKMVGRVEVPQEAFVAALSNSAEPAGKK